MVLEGGEARLQGDISKFWGSSGREVTAAKEKGAGKLGGGEFHPEGGGIRSPPLGAEGHTFTNSKQDAFPRIGGPAGGNMGQGVSGKEFRGKDNTPGFGKHHNVKLRQVRNCIVKVEIGEAINVPS
jgi:hypothetical protein